MRDVKDYYSSRVDGSKDRFYQVGKTVNGVPVGGDQLSIIQKTINCSLRIEYPDCVLDIGAGNGLLTEMIAKDCGHVFAIESNADLIQSAKDNQQSKNVSYFQGDALNWKEYPGAIKKAFAYEVVQHFTYDEIYSFFKTIHDHFPKKSTLFLGGIPDETRKWDFYNNFERRCQMSESIFLEGRDPVGTWYHPDYLVWLSKHFGFAIQIKKQVGELYTSHYRFDCLMELK